MGTCWSDPGGAAFVPLAREKSASEFVPLFGPPVPVAPAPDSQGSESGMDREALRREIRAEMEAAQRAERQRVEKLLQQLAEERERAKKEWVRRTAVAAQAIAERLVRDHLRHEPEAIVRVVEEAARNLEESESATLLVAPADLSVVEPHSESLQALGIVEIKPSPDLAPGECRLDCELGQIRGDLQSQLEAIGGIVDELVQELG